MFPQQSSDRFALFRTHIHKKEILRRSEAHLRLELLSDFAQPCLEPIVAVIFDAPIFNEETKEKTSIGLAVPSQQITLLRELKWPGRLEFDPGALFDLGAAPLCSAFFQNIFN